MRAVLFLAEWAVRSAAVILCGALLLRVMRVKDPAIRLTAWVAMLCGSLAMPALMTTLPETRLALVRLKMLRVSLAQSETPWAIEQAAVTLAGVDSLASPGAPSGVRASRRYDWSRIALAIYISIAAVLLLRLCAGLAMSGRLLRRSRPTGRSADGIEILESDDVSGPVTLGISDPVIVLPNDWRDWQGEKLGAVLAHERSHIRRRDPAVQVVSTIHRALLWHSPLSWFLHRHIVRAAEEMSDDAALAAVRDRASYAEMLLEFMQRGVRAENWNIVAMARYGTPETRIHRILDGTAVSRGITKWSVAAVLAVASPLIFVAAAAHLERAPSPVRDTVAPARETVAPAPEMAAAPTPVTPIAAVRSDVSPRPPVRNKPARLTFEAASVQPSPPGSRGGPVRPLPGGEGYTAQDATLKLMISLMYKVPARQIAGGPDWVDTEGYDIDAKAGRPRNLDDLHAMFQNLLADRFKLRFHREIKEGPVYALMVDAAGLKMRASEGLEQFNYPVSYGPGGIVTGSQAPMPYFSWWLGELLAKDGRPVIDKTGLKQNYDFTLAFAPNIPPGVPRDRIPPEVLARPSIVDALREQLGLELRTEEGPVEYFVIDHVERPGDGIR